jgi:hypothetical protein
MTITAKFAGHCKRCNGEICVGDKIEWEKGKGSWHSKCPATSPKASASLVLHAARGSGYGGRPYIIGQTILLKKDPEQWGVVTKVGSQYYREDGLSFGVGDDQGHVYWAECRPAAADEIAAVVAKRQAAADEKDEEASRVVRVRELIMQIHAGECPEGSNVPEGDVIKISRGQDMYGGGEWFVIGSEWIWHVRNNGSDGADWSANNVRTGGAGAIGWRIPFDVGVAAKLRSIVR